MGAMVAFPSNTQTPVRMVKMKKVMSLVLVSALSACGASHSSNSELSASRRTSVEFTGNDANAVYAALELMGVVDTDRLIGATNLRVSDFRCSKLIHAPVGQQAAPKCEFELKGEGGHSLRVTKMGEGPVTMMDVLSRNGAAVNGGINATAVAGRLLHCSLPVVPSPVARCVVELL